MPSQDSSEPGPKNGSDGQIERSLLVTRSIDYLLYLPEGYAADAHKQWPLILFLSGAGERGSELSLIKKHGMPKVI